MIEEGTTNLLTANQASVETNTSGFVVFGSTVISRDTANYWHGNASLKVVTPGTATDFSTTSIASEVSQTYTASVWLKGSGTVTLRLREMDSSGAYIGDTYSSIITLTNVWKRYSVSRTFGSTGVQGRLQVRTNTTQAITFFADGMQIEQKPYATSWQLPGSNRNAEAVALPLSVLSPNKGSLDFYFLVDSSAQSSSGSAWHMVFAVSESWDYSREGNQIRFAKRQSDGMWVAIFSDSSGVAWSPAFTLADGWHFVTLTWDAAATIAKVFIDGSEVASNTSAPLPSSFANARGGVAHLGKWTINSNYLNSLIDDFRISNRARTLAEHQEAYASGLPLSVDQYTTYLMSFDGHLAPTIW